MTGNMPKGRAGNWLARVFVGGVALFALLGGWMYWNAVTTRIHPNPQEIPSVSYSVPPPKWAGTVAQGRQLIRTTLSQQNLPGVSVAVGIGGDIVWAEGFGFADLKTSQPVTPSHRFRIGTASTALTAAAAAVLLADGRMKLDDSIQTHVPGIPKRQWPVTLRQLMANTSGVNPEEVDGPLFTKHCGRPAEALRYFADSPLRFEPGTQHLYSDYGWILVSAAVEAAAGQPFLKIMRERVFDPLGMRETGADAVDGDPDDDFPLANLFREVVFDPRTTRSAKSSQPAARNPDQHRVTSYFPRFASNPKYGLHLMRPLDYSCYAGGSAFLSTPSDLVRFGMSNKETRLAGRDGDSFGGMVASLMTFPEHGITVAVTSNISYADTRSLASRIAQAFGVPGK